MSPAQVAAEGFGTSGHRKLTRSVVYSTLGRILVGLASSVIASPYHWSTDRANVGTGNARYAPFTGGTF